MRISPDKLNKLAHTVADTLADTDEVGFLEDRNTIRQEARKALTALLAEEAKIDSAARLKIANQRKIIQEGSRSGRFFTASTTTTKCVSWESSAVLAVSGLFC